MRISGIGISPEGFTLLELIFVLFLISIVAAVAFPAFAPLREGGATADAKRMASIIRYLHDNALAMKETFALTVDFDHNTLSFRGPDGEKKESSPHLEAFLPTAGPTIRSGETTVFFTPAIRMEGFTMTFGTGEETLSVRYSPLSGRTQVLTREQSVETPNRNVPATSS